MLKVVLFLGLIVLCLWLFFWRKKPHGGSTEIDAMVECRQCKTFVSQNEAIRSGGSHYCQDCLRRTRPTNKG